MFLTPDILTGMFMESVGSHPALTAALIESFQLVFFFIGPGGAIIDYFHRKLN